MCYLYCECYLNKAQCRANRTPEYEECTDCVTVIAKVDP